MHGVHEDVALFVRPGVDGAIVAHRFVRDAGNWVEDPRGNITFHNAGTNYERYKMNMVFAATTLATSSYTGDAIVLFPRNGAVRTYAYEGGVSRWLDESPVPTDVNAYNPAGAFYDSTSLAIGGADGAIQSIRPTSLCSLPTDTVGGGGGCSRSFAGSCPDPYRATPVCSCAPGYIGEYCDVCDQGFGRNKRGLCVACPGGTFGDRAISTTCVKCSVAEVASGGSASCSVCDNTTYNSGAIPHENKLRCRLCPVGKHVSASRTACIDCSEAEVAREGSEACESCSNGTIPNAEQSKCSTCDPGKHRSASKAGCDACPPNEVRAAFNPSAPVLRYRSVFFLTHSLRPTAQVAIEGSEECTRCNAEDGQIENAEHYKCLTCTDGSYGSPTVVRQDGDIVTVGIPTPVPVQNILSRGGIDLETCDIALLIPVVAYHDVCVQGWGEKNRRN